MSGARRCVVGIQSFKAAASQVLGKSDIYEYHVTLHQSCDALLAALSRVMTSLQPQQDTSVLCTDDKAKAVMNGQSELDGGSAVRIQQSSLKDSAVPMASQVQ